MARSYHSAGSTRSIQEKSDLGGKMRREFAFTGVARRQAERPVRSIACLAFVAVLGVAFWAGAAWIGQSFLHLVGPVF
jgi:hypothetical protein